MEEDPQIARKTGKQHNVLPIWGNESSMNLNPLILANIQSSSYFKVHLFKLKTYHEVVDEIYYQVKHMEPWERGSRKTAGQTGMCGGVRGVGAGGIVSTAYCLLYKLYTLRLTRKQVNGLLNHTDSPYIRALGFMYLRYTQPPADLFDWYADYLHDEEEIDVKAGGGQLMTIGQMVYQFLTKLEWFSTLFPRIPVPIQKQLEKRLEQYCLENQISVNQLGTMRTVTTPNVDENYERRSRDGPSSSREVVAPVAHYRSEHDIRNNSTSKLTHGRRTADLSPSQSRHSRHQYDSEHKRDRRHHEKHKKKHKRKHYSRSRSRSRSPSRSRCNSRNDTKYEKRERDNIDRRYR